MISILLIPLAISLVLVVQLFLFAARSLTSPLKSVRGPFLARFTDLWYFFSVKKGKFEVTNQELHKKYGPIVRYGPNRFSINDPDAIGVIYGLGGQFAKSSWYSTWGAPGTWTLFSDQSVQHHSRTRRLYQSTYSMTSLITYEPYVNECNRLFTQRLKEMADSGMPIDMGHWFQCYAFDVIGMVTYGRRLGFLDQGDDIGGVIGALEEHLEYATLIGIYPGLHRYLYSIKNYLAGAKGAGRAYVLSFTKQRMHEHQTTPKVVPEDVENSSGMVDFLTKFFAKHASDPENFTAYHILTGLTSNMVAGSDTTAISLSAILYHLILNPHCMKALQDEINELSSQGKLSEFPTFAESQEMPYLQAVIKEALRMHPATGLPLERVVPSGGATISGQYFPEGTIVGVNTWVEHRDARIFGNDADIFRPERWFEEDKSRLSAMNRHWMPFGLGSRTCIGRHVSMLEMSKLLPKLLRDFEFSLDKPSGSMDKAWETNNFWFVKPKGFKVQAKVRAK